MKKNAEQPGALDDIGLKRLTVRMPKYLYEQMKQRAKRNKISLNRCICDTLAEMENRRGAEA